MRVVRFYVQCFLLLLRRLLRILLVFRVTNCDNACSVFRAGPQARSCEFSVPCRTSTAIRCVQCSAPDPDRVLVSSVFRAAIAILWVQYCADLNRDPVRPAFRAGPQSRNVSERRIAERVSEDMSEKECQKICQKEEYQIECQKLCQKEC